MAKWILNESAASDASGVLRPVLPTLQVGESDGAGSQLAGFQDLVQSAQLPDSAARALLNDILELGAVSVNELTVADWESLSSWAELRMLQTRRVMQHLFGPRAEWGAQL